MRVRGDGAVKRLDWNTQRKLADLVWVFGLWLFAIGLLFLLIFLGERVTR